MYGYGYVNLHTFYRLWLCCVCCYLSTAGAEFPEIFYNISVLFLLIVTITTPTISTSITITTTTVTNIGNNAYAPHRWLPQMATTTTVLEKLRSDVKRATHLSVLTPNRNTTIISTILLLL